MTTKREGVLKENNAKMPVKLEFSLIGILYNGSS